MDETKLKRYQDKQFKKIVQFAYTVPLYHDVYNKHGVHPNDIHGIKDITKLPIVTKHDFKKYYPNGIISNKIRKDKLIEVSTSGTTGKSLSIYVEMLDIVIGLFGYIRTLREYGINWRKEKITIIGDFAPHTVESGYIEKGLSPSLSWSGFLKNIQWLDTNDDPKKIIEKINKFKPVFIGGYTGMLGHLALLKEKGYGKDISPRVIASTGSVLDNSLKNYIEKQFNSPVFEAYGATESGLIAYTCKNGNYHIMSDFVYLEFIKDNISVESKKPGKMVVTKLFGKGTPIIRYDAINDIIAPLYEKCDCGLSGDLIQKIYGRDDISLILPDGKLLLASSISNIYSKVLYKLKTNMLKDTYIVQHDIDKIEIQVLFDIKQKKKDVSVEDVMELIKSEFVEIIGSKVNIDIKEVKKIDKKGPRIVSKINKNKVIIKDYV